jgi:hypothetical protein
MKLFACLNYVILFKFLFYSIYVLLFIQIKLSCQFFGAGVLGAPLWEASPNFEGGPPDAPKTAQSVSLPVTNLGAPVKMLLHPKVLETFPPICENKL